MKRFRLAFAALLLLQCESRESLPPGPDDPAKNLALYDVFADRVQTEAMRAAWTNTAAKPFGVRPLLDLRDREVEALNARLADPRQRQCLQAIHALAIRMQSESDPRVTEALAPIAALRQEAPDPGRTLTPEESAIAKRLAPHVRRLIAARNQWARERDGSDYLALMQKQRGYDPTTAARLEEEVRRALPASIANAQEGDWSTRFDAAHCLERASFVFTWIGLPSHPPALHVREAKQTAFSSFAFYAIDPPAEQGITVKPGAGIAPHWSAFHEYGHAAMSLMTEPTSCRTFRRPIAPAVSESCAKITERLVYSPEWLRTQHVPHDEIEALRREEISSERTRMRRILDDIAIERDLYRDPNRLDPSSALKRHLSFEPLARADYLLARCAQAAVYRRLRHLPGGLLGDPARRVLRDEIFRGATALRFEEWFRRATGEEPNCRAWVEDVAGLQWPMNGS